MSHLNEEYMWQLNRLMTQPDGPAPRGMRTKEIIGAVILLDTNDCVLTLPTRRLSYHFMVAEFLWIATARDDVASIAPYNKKIADFSDDGVTFFGAYGPRWRDDVNYAIDTLAKDKDSRQAIVRIWRRPDQPTKDVPCTLSMQYLLRRGKLNTIATMRSSDAWLGLPYDIFNFAMLAKCVAGELSVPVGTLQMQLGSLHVYESNFAAVRSVINSDGHIAKVSQPVKLPDLPGLVPLAIGMKMAHGPSHSNQYAAPWNIFLEVLESRFRPVQFSANNPFGVLIESDTIMEGESK